MDVSLEYFLENIAGKSDPADHGSAYSGRDLCQRMDRRTECDRHLCDDTVLKSAQGDPDECGL